MATGNITGRLEIRVGSQLLLSKKGASMEWGGEEREPVVEDTYHGYRTMLKEARITVSTTDRDDVSVENLVAVTDADMNFAAINGKTYYGPHFTCKGNPKFTDGAWEWEFFGPAMKETGVTTS